MRTNDLDKQLVVLALASEYFSARERLYTLLELSTRLGAHLILMSKHGTRENSTTRANWEKLSE